MYGLMLTQVEHLHAAYEWVLLINCYTLVEHSQYDADVAFLTTHFMRKKPFNLPEFLRTNPEIVPA